MYGEAALGGDWLPARFQEINKEMVRCTIIGSVKAQNFNVIGIDLNLPKYRAQLLEEPKELQRLEDYRAYGLQHGRRRHARHASAVPSDAVLHLPVNLSQLLPFISEPHLELLEFCLRKYHQRIKRIDKTWKLQREIARNNIRAYTQYVTSTSVRIQARCIVTAPKFIIERVLNDNLARLDCYGDTDYDSNILKAYGDEMKILKKISRPSASFLGIFSCSPRESVVYDWNFFWGNTHYSLRCSLETDDPTGFGQIEHDSPNIRATVHPGTGFTYTQLEDYKTEIILCAHVDPGGWIPVGPYIRAATNNIVERLQDLVDAVLAEFEEDDLGR